MKRKKKLENDKETQKTDRHILYWWRLTRKLLDKRQPKKDKTSLGITFWRQILIRF